MLGVISINVYYKKMGKNLGVGAAGKMAQWVKTDDLNSSSRTHMMGGEK